MLIRVCIGSENQSIPKLCLQSDTSLKYATGIKDVRTVIDIELESQRLIGENGKRGYWSIYRLDIPQHSILRLRSCKNTQHENYMGECWLRTSKYAPEKRVYISLAMEGDKGGWIHGNIEYIKGVNVVFEEVNLVE